MLCAAALAGGVRVVSPGDTVEEVAAMLEDPTLVPRIRELNQLGPGEQPEVGQLLRLPDPTQAHADQQAWFMVITGDATVQPPGGPARPAVVHELLPRSAVLCTAKKSFAALRIATQCTLTGDAGDDITLGPSTCVRVDAAFSTVDMRSSVVTVLSGSISVQSTTAEGSFTVVSDGAVTTGSGGGYRVSVVEDVSRTEALYAPVAVQGAGKEVRLDAGQGSQVKAGEAPSDPIDLLPPGKPIRPYAGGMLVEPTFTWTTVKEAFGYRVEIGGDPDFREVLYAEQVPDAEHEATTLLLPWPTSGVLFWRIASADRMGFVGAPSPPREMRLPTRSPEG